jgi:hypothetical protein
MTDDKDSAVTPADRDAMQSIIWVNTIIDDQDAIAQAFARHRQYGYDQGYYDGYARAALDARALEIRSKDDDGHPIQMAEGI